LSPLIKPIKKGERSQSVLNFLIKINTGGKCSSIFCKKQHGSWKLKIVIFQSFVKTIIDSQNTLLMVIIDFDNTFFTHITGFDMPLDWLLFVPLYDAYLGIFVEFYFSNYFNLLVWQIFMSFCAK